MKRSKAYIILIFWALFCLGITLKLFFEHRFYAASGWTAITIIFTFFVLIYFLPDKVIFVRKRKQPGSRSLSYQNNSKTKKYGNYALLISTKDLPRSQAIIDALSGNHIHYVVLDQHAAQIMRFLPDLEMRIMVPVEDLGRSKEAVRHLIEEEF